MKHPEIIVQQDIYDENKVLLLSKGTQIVLTPQKYRQLESLGILDDVISPETKKQILDDLDAHNIHDESIRELTKKATKEISNRLCGINSYDFRRTTEILETIIFDSKDKDWHRYVSLISSYVNWLYTHSLDTAIISGIIACALGCADNELFDICIGGLLHDIGLTLLPRQTLLKFTELTHVEDYIVRNHCDMGYSMIFESDLSQTSKEIVLQHHERLDGSGFPNKLREHQLSTETLITIVAEYFDTATTTKKYKPAETIESTIERMSIQDNKFPRDIIQVLTNITMPRAYMKICHAT